MSLVFVIFWCVDRLMVLFYCFIWDFGRENGMKIIVVVVWLVDVFFGLEEVEIDELCEDEILVWIVGVGLCYMDFVFKGVGSDVYLLFVVFGYEGLGVVEKVGVSVIKVVVGDLVVIIFWLCGVCDWCVDGDVVYCWIMLFLNYVGVWDDGMILLCGDGGEIWSNFFG